MPLYEYDCAECRQTFEVLLSRHDSPPGPCPNCGSARISRRVSAGAFRIDGNFSCPAPAKPKPVAAKEAGETAPTPWEAHETTGMAVINPGPPEGEDA